MTMTTTAKVITGAAITACFAGGIALTETIGKGYLYEINNSRAALQTASAEMEKAKAMTAAAQETANATISAAKDQAAAIERAAKDNMRGMIISSQHIADGQIKSADTTAHADNKTYDDITAPLVAEPLSKVARLNGQLLRIEQQIAGGTDPKTGNSLSDSQLAKLGKQKAEIEQELLVTKSVAGKNMRDALEVAMSGLSGMLPQLMNQTGSNARNRAAAPPTPPAADPQPSSWLPRNRYF